MHTSVAPEAPRLLAACGDTERSRMRGIGTRVRHALEKIDGSSGTARASMMQMKATT